MFVEIGALVEKSVGNDALHKIIDCNTLSWKRSIEIYLRTGNLETLVRQLHCHEE